MFLTLGALKTFSNFTGKIYLLESLFKEASGPQACKLVKKKHRYFPVKFARFSRALFFTEHLHCLVFTISNSNNIFKDFSGIPLTHN